MLTHKCQHYRTLQKDDPLEQQLFWRVQLSDNSASKGIKNFAIVFTYVPIPSSTAVVHVCIISLNMVIIVPAEEKWLCQICWSLWGKLNLSIINHDDSWCYLHVRQSDCKRMGRLSQLGAPKYFPFHVTIIMSNPFITTGAKRFFTPKFSWHMTLRGYCGPFFKTRCIYSTISHRPAMGTCFDLKLFH